MSFDATTQFKEQLFERLKKVQDKQAKNETLTEEDFAFLLMSTVLEEEG